MSLLIKNDFVDSKINVQKIDLDEFKFSSIIITINGVISFLYIFISVYLEFNVGIIGCIFLVIANFLLLVSLKIELISQKLLTNLMAILNLCILFPIGYYTGGATSPVNAWLIATVTSIFLVGTSQQKYFWGTLVIGTQLINFFMFLQGHSFPHHIKPEQRDLFNLLLISGSVIYVVISHLLIDRWKNQISLRIDNIVSHNDGLKRLNQQYKDVQAMVKAGAWELDVASEAIIWSEQIYHIYKIPLDTEINIKLALSYYQKDDKVKISSLINNCISQKREFDEVFEFMDRLGGRKWVRSIGKPILSHEGDVLKVIGTFQDVTEVVSSRFKLDLFFKKAPYGIVFCDMNGVFLEMNEELERITGYTIEELQKLSYWDLTPEKYRSQEEIQLNALQTYGAYGPYSKEYRRKDGECVPVELRGFLVENYDGQKGIWSIIQDISEKNRLNAELEHQRRVSLHNSKLASIGELASGIGHEINNPLAIIQGQMEMLKKHCQNNKIEDKNIQERILKSQKSVERISNIIKGLRSFARADEAVFTQLNVSELLIETIDMLVEIYHQNNISIVTEIHDDLWMRGNRGRLQQVYVNLLNNSKDALRNAKDKKIKVRAFSSADRIIIEFRDTGHGIPLDIKEKIFEPFFTTKEINEGTGIGLSLVSNIVQEHGGTITITETNEHGTCFTITSSKIPRPHISDEFNPEPIEIPKLMGNILVVDDEEDLREILQDLLEQYGLNVVTINNGHDALEYIKNNFNKIDVVLTDMQMPRMNGLELIKAAKELKNFGAKFILVSGGINLSQEEHIGLADAILPKPFDEAKIIDLIQMWTNAPKS